MNTINDFRKIHKQLYVVHTQEVHKVEPGMLSFITAKGRGPRNVYDLHQSDEIWSITRVVNRLKNMTKKTLNYKFKLMPLEVEWARVDGTYKEEGDWTLFMQVPDIITQEMFKEAVNELEKRNRQVRVPVYLQEVDQGPCLQSLHIGPYNTVEHAINRITQHNPQSAQAPIREIYINQPFCNAPEKVKTIVRIPLSAIPEK